jgi:hypothetical protein
MKTRTIIPGLLAVSVLLVGCSAPRAGREECERILERIVEIELVEQGYRDPALVERKQSEARSRFAPDVERCIGRRIPDGAMACIDAATDTETLTHDCLRR